MADRLAVVEINPLTGRPAEVRNLNVADDVYLQRGTLKFTPAGRRPRMVQSASRFGGARQVGESSENASVEGVFSVKGTSEADALTKLESVLDITTDSSVLKQALEFRPEGQAVAKASYMPIRGAATAAPRYARVELNSYLLGVDLSFPVAPLVEGLPMAIVDDPFNSGLDTDADYTAIVGTAANFNGAAIVMAANSILAHTARGYLYRDVEVMAMTNVPTAAPTDFMTPGLKHLDANNFLYATYINGAPGTVQIWKRDGGVSSQLATTSAVTAPTAGQNARLLIRIVGNVVEVEWWNITEAFATGVPTASVAHTLTGGDITKFGAAVAGGVMPKAVTSSVAVNLIRFSVFPYSRRRAALPIVVDLKGIPGTAPARLDVHLGHALVEAAAPAFGLVGWTDAPGTPFGAKAVAFGKHELETVAANVAGFASTALAGSSGGNVMRAALASAGGTASLKFALDPSTLAGDAWAGDVVPLEVWVCHYLPSTAVAPRLVLYNQYSNEVNTRTYSLEHGSTGKALILPTSGSSVRRFTKAGTILVDRSTVENGDTYLDLAYGVGSTGNVDLDYLFMVPASRRLASPTGKTNDNAYPKFQPAGGHKRILSDGRARRVDSNWSARADQPSPALGGAVMDVGPGDVQVAVKASALVPDDPIASSAGEDLLSTQNVRMDIVPRWRGFRV